MEGIKDGEESLVKMWGMFNRKDIIVQSALQISNGDQVICYYHTTSQAFILTSIMRIDVEKEGTTIVNFHVSLQLSPSACYIINSL